MRKPVSAGRYRVGGAATLAGVPVHTLRIWERRYGPFASARSPGGNRLYTDDDVEMVRQLRKLVERGHPIGMVTSLSQNERARLLSHAEAPPVQPSAVAVLARTGLLEATRAFDTRAAEELLARLALALPPRTLVEEVLGPVLRVVGRCWADGSLAVAHEHAISNVVRGHLFSLLRANVPAPAGVVVAATPDGEGHELGALFAALLALGAGFRVVYLGASVPAADLAAAVATTNACAVLVSLVSLARPDRALAAIRGALPEGVALIAGGPATPAHHATRLEQIPAALQRAARAHRLSERA